MRHLDSQAEQGRCHRMSGLQSLETSMVEVPLESLDEKSMKRKLQAQKSCSPWIPSMMLSPDESCYSKRGHTSYSQMPMIEAETWLLDSLSVLLAKVYSTIRGL